MLLINNPNDLSRLFDEITLAIEGKSNLPILADFHAYLSTFENLNDLSSFIEYKVKEAIAYMTFRKVSELENKDTLDALGIGTLRKKIDLCESFNKAIISTSGRHITANEAKYLTDISSCIKLVTSKFNPPIV